MLQASCTKHSKNRKFSLMRLLLAEQERFKNLFKTLHVFPSIFRKNTWCCNIHFLLDRRLKYPDALAQTYHSSLISDKHHGRQALTQAAAHTTSPPPQQNSLQNQKLKAKSTCHFLLLKKKKTNSTRNVGFYRAIGCKFPTLQLTFCMTSGNILVVPSSHGYSDSKFSPAVTLLSHRTSAKPA